MFEKLWNHRRDYQDEHKKALSHRMRKIEREVDKLIDRMVDTDLSTVVSACEKKVKRLESEKVIVQEKIANFSASIHSFEATFRTALRFLANPYEIWASGRLENQRAVLKLAFEKNLTYIRGEGFRTAKTTLPFRYLGGLCEPNSSMVGRAGFEPATNWLKANCSTN